MGVLGAALDGNVVDGTMQNRDQPRWRSSAGWRRWTFAAHRRGGSTAGGNPVERAAVPHLSQPTPAPAKQCRKPYKRPSALRMESPAIMF